MPSLLLGLWIGVLGSLTGKAEITTMHLNPPVQAAQTEVQVFPEKPFAVPGHALTFAIYFKLNPGWHTYWRFPGETGSPARTLWSGASGTRVVPLQWPVPARMDTPLVSIGYEGEVVLLQDLILPENWPANSVHWEVEVRWLACEKTCIPGKGRFSFRLPVKKRAEITPSELATEPEFQLFRRDLPTQLKASDVTVKLEGSHWRLKSHSAWLPRGFGQLEFFPLEANQIDLQAVLDGPATPELGIRIPRPKETVALSGSALGETKLLTGLLVGKTTEGRRLGFQLGGDTPPSVIPPATEGGTVVSADSVAPERAQRTVWFWLQMVLWAFLGGLVLNLMPCVFPILSIKVLGFLHDSEKDRAQSLLLGGLFAVGVVVSFLILATALAVFKAAGQKVGWGFQLQSPGFVVFLILLFQFLAWNLLGLFEVPVLMGGSLLRWTSTAGGARVRAFGDGVLAALVASPCTAPFMGTALGFALGRSLLESYVIFIALGLGMSFPYLIFSFFPKALKALPKPGAWLETLKQFLAFPLLATAVWLLWVFGQLTSLDSVARVLLASLFVGILIWSLNRFRQRSWSFLFLAVAVYLAISAVQIASKKHLSPWKSWSAETMQMELKKGHVVFIDFTAAWCLTCQVNKKWVFERSEILQEMVQSGVVLMQGDWTQEDPQITEILRKWGRSGVPVYALVLPQSPEQPVLFPEVLTPDLFIQKWREALLQKNR